MKRYLLTIGLLSVIIIVNAARVDTLEVYSNSMKKHIKTFVITPDNYFDDEEPFPVLYLLHGAGGDFASYVNNFPQTLTFVDQYEMIIVCPDGDRTSWYFDSPVDSLMRYETFITNELVSYIDNRFNTIDKTDGRAIAGLSMGGHGALFLAIRHQDIFGASGSISGGVDFRPFPKKWDMAKRLGEKELYSENWEKNIVLSQLYLLTDDRLSIIFDCGVDDFFIDGNRKLHDNLLYLNIKHDYIERPGGHTLEYFKNALQYQVLYFDNFFRRE